MNKNLPKQTLDLLQLEALHIETRLSFLSEEILYDEPTGRLALVFELMDMRLGVTPGQSSTSLWLYMLLPSK